MHLMIAVPTDLLLKNPVFIGPFDKSVPEAEKFKLRYWQCRHLRSLMQDLFAPMSLELGLTLLWWYLILSSFGMVQGFLKIMAASLVSSTLFISFTQPAHINAAAMKNMEANTDIKESFGGESNMRPDQLVGFADKSLHGEDPEIVRPEVSKKELEANRKRNAAICPVKDADTAFMGRWVREQCAHTVDCDAGSVFTFFISGGLNMQSIHHVLPIVSQAHYVEMYPGFQKVLAKHGVCVSPS